MPRFGGGGGSRQFFAMRANGCNPYAASAVSGVSRHGQSHGQSFSEMSLMRTLSQMRTLSPAPEVPLPVAPQARASASAAPSKPAKAVPPPVVAFPVGSVMRISGLQQRPDLNGQLGIIVEGTEAQGRWKIRMTDSFKMIKAENLTIVYAPQVSTSASGAPSKPSKAPDLKKEKTSGKKQPGGVDSGDIVSVKPVNLHVGEAPAAAVPSSPRRLGSRPEPLTTPDKKKRRLWKPEEADKLRNAMEQCGQEWERISKVDGLEHFTVRQLMDKSKNMKTQARKKE